MGVSRSARLFQLLQALRRQRRPVTAAALAAELGVSARSIYRDVATLVGEGAPIVGEAGVGFVLLPGFTLPPLSFEDDELEALMLGLRLVAREGDAALAKAAADARGKIAAVLSASARRTQDEAALLAGMRAERPDTPHIAIVRQAIRGERKLTFGYLDGAGRETSRTVWPFALAFFEEARVLAAWCETRAAFRHFRLDRIVTGEISAQRYPKRRGVLLAAWRAEVGAGSDL